MDSIAGEDVPETPELPEVLDHGIVIGGHLEGGIGAAVKASISDEFGNGGVKAAYSYKIGVPLYGGFGVTFGVK